MKKWPKIKIMLVGLLEPGFGISIQWLFNHCTIDTFWKNVADIFDNNLRPEAIASIAWTQVRLWVQTKEEDGPG